MNPSFISRPVTFCTRFCLPLALLCGAGVLSAGTVAYYNFEEGSDGLAVNSVDASGGANSRLVSGGADSTNAMVAYSIANSPHYTTTQLPVTAFGNALALSFDGGDDLYQRTPASSVLATKAFQSFTIEAYVMFNGTNFGAYQTFVGRDDSGNPGQGVGAQSLFYLSKGGSGLNNVFRVELITASNTDIQINSSVTAVANRWYHVAVVGDATAGTLRLYVDGQLAGSTTGFTGLRAPSAPTSWTLGRGQYAGKVADQLNGWLDQVRFCDVALDPSQFLSAGTPEEGTTIMISDTWTPATAPETVFISRKSGDVIAADERKSNQS